jgi:hypothetical protein
MMTRVRAAILLLIVISLACVDAQGTQAPAKPYEPSVGQAGKDVVWVPT